ncbi:hypothetical protein KY285_024932 [Solanum tuberosum]|nr:hypothetical protein KY285_024932 [Solanum tuberosum]KAH0722939.1 hypothetical protein KY289_005983 [Solanum tuberosum]
MSLSSECLPLSWLVQASTYNVKIGEETVITTVTDREAIVISSISALKSELKTPDPFVGIDNEFLWDKSITFIGPRNISQNSTESYISSSTLEELLGEVVVDIKKPIINEGSMRPNWQ